MDKKASLFFFDAILLSSASLNSHGLGLRGLRRVDGLQGLQRWVDYGDGLQGLRCVDGLRGLRRVDGLRGLRRVNGLRVFLAGNTVCGWVTGITARGRITGITACGWITGIPCRDYGAWVDYGDSRGLRRVDSIAIGEPC